MKDLVSIKRPVTDCGKPIVKLEAYSGCDVDAFTGDFYGEGDVQTKSDGFGGTIGFKKTTNLHANISRVPRKITRTISYFCKTQKVRSSKLWQLEGLDIYPGWKMAEIEEMLEAETIVIDGEEVIYRGDEEAFRLALNSCKDMFLMRMQIEDCAKQQIFGCKKDCKTNNDRYINVTDGIFGGDMSASKFYNSSKALIASSYDGFKEWLRVQNGVTDVQEVDNSAMKCSSYKVLKVSGGSNLDTSYYATLTNQNNKIYLRSVNNINDLCNNQDNTVCTPLVFGTPTLIKEECDALIFGTPIINKVGADCTVIPMNGWVQGAGDTSFTAGIDSNSINLSIKNPGYPDNNSSTTLNYDYTNDTGSSVCFVTLPSGIGATINSVSLNGVTISPSGYSFNPSNGVLTLTDCMGNGQSISISFNTPASATVSLFGETIAQINGGCLPLEDTYITNSCNSSIPAGVTVVIGADGTIKWWGQLTSSDSSFGYIDVTNLVYKT